MYHTQEMEGIQQYEPSVLDRYARGENSILSVYTVKGVTEVEQAARTGAHIQQLITTARGADRSTWGMVDADKLWLQWINNDAPTADDETSLTLDLGLMAEYNADVLQQEEDIARLANSYGKKEHPPQYLARTLVYPSLQALDSLQLSVLQRQNSNIALHTLYRVTKELGSGQYGLVLGMTMRTGEMDLKILDVLYQQRNERIEAVVEALNELFRDTPKNLAVKVSWNSVESVNEYIVGRALAPYTLGKGHKCIPAYYSLFSHPSGKEIAAPIMSSLANPALVAGRVLSSNQWTYYLYQEYLSGKTLNSLLNDANYSSIQANGTFCYLHGMLSYLYKQTGIVHADLHQNNVLMLPHPGGIALPIVDEDGAPLTYLLLDYQPVFIDFGLSKTRAIARNSDHNLYNTSQIQDIIYLNRGVNISSVRKRQLISYNLAKQLLANDIDLDVAKFVPPFFEYLAEGTLTHSVITRTILDSGEVETIKTNPPVPIIRSGMGLYTGRDDVPRQDILRRTEEVNEAYKKVPDSIFKGIAQKYLDETYRYYKDN